MDRPRLLILTSNNFNLVTGGGITLTNLFSGWPRDHIASLHEDSQAEDHSVCDNSYRLTHDEIRWFWPLSMVEPRTKGGEALGSGDSVSKGVFGLSRNLFGDGIPRRFELTSRLQQWIGDFQPEIIYSFLGSMAQIRIAASLTAKLQIPLVVHIMDDWPAVIYRHGLFGPLIRRTVLSEFKALLQAAVLRLAICDEMCKEFRFRYGYDFLPFHNAIDMNEWKRNMRSSWNRGVPFVVRYAGSIVADAQQESLRDFCVAISRLRSEGIKIELWVHAPANQRAYLATENFDGLHLCDPPDPALIVHLLSSADLLVLPFNFDPDSAQYMRLSMPTKIPAYMASGTPVLVYGPPEIAAVMYAKRDGWGYVLDHPSIPNLQASIRELMEDQGLREVYGRRAHVVASRHHDAAEVRHAFQSKFVEAVRNSKKA